MCLPRCPLTTTVATKDLDMGLDSDDPSDSEVWLRPSEPVGVGAAAKSAGLPARSPDFSVAPSEAPRCHAAALQSLPDLM